MYRCFMLLYVDEYDDDTLDSLGLDEVDDATVGFAEMMSIKLGELMDQPRHVRVQALQTELAKKEEVHAWLPPLPCMPPSARHHLPRLRPHHHHCPIRSSASPTTSTLTTTLLTPIPPHLPRRRSRGSPSRSRRRRTWRWRRR